MKICSRFVFVLSLAFFSLQAVLAQLLFSESATLPPKREFRGAWIATVANLDWPSSPSLPPETQQNDFVTILDNLKAVGINAIVFQIRPECDAFYASTKEPWSYWLTGQQGKAPSPFYDPLQFAIDAAHKRGMELHAWFNPYRAVRSVGSYMVDSTHVSVRHPDWVLNFGTLKILDPGLPQVRDYVTSVILEVVRRYDIDGFHFDDYFYPYPPNQITNQDDSTFARYNRGFTDRGDWRRDNVNLFVRQIHDSIQVVKPYVKFGISPFGIWKNGVPPDIVGLDAYNVLYCDAVAWLKEKTVDYITPQLYWQIGGSQDYSKLIPWWVSQTNTRHLYVGQALYRGWPASEMANQIRLNRSNSSVHGSIFFRAAFITSNTNAYADSLRADFYRYPAFLPSMAWKDSIPPNSARNLRYERSGLSSIVLRWDAPTRALDGDTAVRYAIYRFNSPPNLPGDLEDATKLLSVGSGLTKFDSPPVSSNPYYYVVTALDRNYNESAASNVLPITVTSVASELAQIVSYALYQNYPNPFNPVTTILYRIPSEARVSLRVYDVLGREVKVLVNAVVGPGEHKVYFNGGEFPSGVYFYKLESKNFVDVKKMMILK